MTRALLAVALVAAAVALPGLRGGFVYDDVPVVAQDQRIRTLHTGLAAVPYWGGEVDDRIWRPATTLSFAADWAVGGGAPLPFHLTNLLLHALTAVLVTLVAARVVGAGGAVVAGLVFAAHPVHVEAFAPVVGRSELLAAAAYLAAVLAYARDGTDGAGRRARLGWTLLTLIAAALAFGAKEHAFTLPAALLLTDGWEARRRGERLSASWRRHALLWAAVVVLAAGFLAARGAVVASVLAAGNVAAGLDGLSAWGRLTVMLPAFLVWLRLLVLPVRLSADYGPAAFIPAPQPGVTHLVAVLVLAGLVALVWRYRARVPALGWALLWFVVTVAVGANVLVPTGVLLAERVLYLPSVALAVAAGALWERAPRGRWLWPVTAALLTILAARAVARTEVWRDEERFFAALERDAPESFRTWWARGARAFAAGDARGGEAAYRRALALNPDPAIMQELGDRYMAAGALVPADRWFTLAWTADSTREAAATKAVLARLDLGRAEEAASLGEAALLRFGTTPLLLRATAEAWRMLGRPVKALTLLRRAAFAEPGSWHYQLLAADGAAGADRCEEARWRAARAHRIAGIDQDFVRVRDRLEGLPRCRLDP